MLALVIGLAVIVLAALVSLFAARPGRPNEEQKKAFWGRNVAHRGLFTADQSVPENSLPAFRLAAAEGYGAELDVQLSRDGQVVVFHDDTLARACGVEKRVDSLDFSQLQELSLFGTNKRIPLFSTVLEALGGKEPLIVELKTGPRNAELCEKTLALLKTYGGVYCIESFDPFIVQWFRKNAPYVLRGQLAQPPRCYKGAVKPATAFLLGNTLLNFLARPQFIAYRIGKKPLAVRFAEKCGALRFAWTSRDPAAEKDFDAVIFEHYKPKNKYK